MQRPLLWVLDRVVIPVASGAIFVRIGNFFNSEIYGNITSKDAIFAVRFIKDEEFWKNHSLRQITQQANIKDGYNLIQNDPKFSAVLNEIPFRHPAQMYESVCYIFVFLILYFLYWKTDAKLKQGYLFGIFLVLLWSVRFVVEFVKESQGGFEDSIGIFSTGQWLSIPFILIGLYFVIRANTISIKKI